MPLELTMGRPGRRAYPMFDAAHLLIGSSIDYEGQNYTLRARHEYTNRAGRKVTILDWQSVCPACGASFVFTSPVRFRQPNRRCRDCHRPGSPVHGERRRRKETIDA
jgi:hypothetical protein